MKVLTKKKKVTNKDRNVSLIIEEAALDLITVVIDSKDEKGGRYAINLGEYLGKSIKHSIKVLEDAKKKAEADDETEDESGVPGDTDGDVGLPTGGVHLE